MASLRFLLGVTAEDEVLRFVPLFPEPPPAPELRLVRGLDWVRSTIFQVGGGWNTLRMMTAIVAASHKVIVPAGTICGEKDIGAKSGPLALHG